MVAMGAVGLSSQEGSQPPIPSWWAAFLGKLRQDPPCVPAASLDCSPGWSLRDAGWETLSLQQLPSSRKAPACRALLPASARQAGRAERHLWEAAFTPNKSRQGWETHALLLCRMPWLGSPPTPRSPSLGRQVLCIPLPADTKKMPALRMMLCRVL